jgi:putative peptidoglycan lipid II flippase
MVKNFLSLLNARQNSILSGASILMLTVFASKFLGLIKDRLLVHNFTTAQTDIFFAAFNLPDLMYQLLIFGTLSVAFIPIFTDFLHNKGEKEAFNFASNILNLSMLVFGIVTVLSFIFVPPINMILVPGFEGSKKDLTDQLTRIVLFSQVFFVVGSFFVGVAQSYQRFIIPSLAPFFYNLGIIFGIVVLSPFIGIYGPAVGAVLGAFMHVGIQLPMIKSLGFKYHLTFDFFNSGVHQVFKMMSLRNISLVAEAISDKVALALASLVSEGSLTVFNFSQHLYTAPIGLFGATIAQAALPILSREQARGETESFKRTLLTTMHQILFLTLPAAAILIVLRIPVVRLVFGASQFNWSDTVLTGRTVAFLSLGLAAQSVILLLVRGFYALKDTKTPVIVSVTTVVLNILLSLLFVRVWYWDVWSLGLAYAVSTNVSLLMLLYFLNKKVGGFNFHLLFEPALKMLVASSTAAVALYIPIKALDQLVFDTTHTVNLIILTGIAALFGLGIYLVLVWLMDVKELSTYVDLIKKISRLQKNVETQEMVQETGMGGGTGTV